MPKALKDTVALVRGTYDKFCADGCPRVGAALAYYSLFSLFPLLLLLISIMSFLLASGVPLLVDARTYVLDSVGNVLPEARDLLARSIDSALAARGATGLIGLFTLLWSSSNVFTQLYQAMNVIWGCVPEPTIGAAVRSKLTAIAVVLAIGLLLALSMVASVVFDVALGRAHLLGGMRLLGSTLAPLTSAAMATMTFALLYRYLPHSRVRWRYVWPGALVAGVAWEALRIGFTEYARRTNYVAVYGVVGSTIALLTWIYLSAQVLFFGAEFAVVYARLKTGTSGLCAPEPAAGGESAGPRPAGVRARAVEGLRAVAVGVAELLQGTWQGFQRRPEESQKPGA